MSKNNLNWKNVHGIGFDDSRLDDTRENKVKVLNQILKGDVTIEDSELDRYVLHIHKYDDYVDVFHSNDSPQQALQEMEDTIQRIEQEGIPTPLFTKYNLMRAVGICRQIHDPDLPDITDSSEVLAYCV